MNQDIVIPLSKQKLLFLMLGAAVFVILGVLFIIYPARFTNVIFSNTTFINIIGLVSIIFFGLCLFAFLSKVRETSPGLIISKDGILDNSSAISVGKIYWTDIEDIDELKIAREKLIRIKLKNPQDYIDRQSSSIAKRMMTMNNKMYDSPIHISANALKISFDELFLLLNEKREEVQRQTSL